MNALEFAKENRERHLKEMMECIRMETISADPTKKGEIERCGKWLVEKLKKIGLENACLKETGGFPAVYADWLHAGKDKPTIMIYGHLDVQPADPVEKWSSPPFEPTIRDGFIYGRGTSDDKGQFLTHIFAVESLMKESGKLPVNVKVFIESEEEGGTGSTESFVEHHAKELACDAVIVSDTSWPTPEIPTMIYALRGIAYFQVGIKGPDRDLHSGTYGGRVQNPLNAMACIAARLHDDEGRIAIPGIYDDVAELTAAERSEFAKVPGSDDELKKNLSVSALWGEKGYTANERNWGRPSLDINGMWGGYMGEGGKTVIPSECGFKVSMRLVPNQTPERVHRLLADYVKKICPPGVTADVEFMHGGVPVMVSPENPFVGCASKAVERAFGKRPLLIREGASVPITATFIKALGAPPILMGFGLHDDCIHSPDEKFKLDHFYRGIEAAINFLSLAAEVEKKQGKYQCGGG